MTDFERIADELGELTSMLLGVVRKLPPGQIRQDALKELGRVRGRLDLAGTANSSGTVKKESARRGPDGRT